MDSKYGILFVRLFGELTRRTRKKFNNEVCKLLEKVGIKNVVFNLENVYKNQQLSMDTLLQKRGAR